MKNPKFIFAAILSAVVCFAGYNLWSYFKEQQAIQVAEDLRAEEQRVQRVQERKVKEEAAAQKAKRQEEEAAAERAEAQRIKEEARAVREAKELARKEKAEQDRLAKEADRLAKLTKRARTIDHIEGIPPETIAQLNSVSARYITDKPDEFTSPRFDSNNLGAVRGFEKLLKPNTNALMLYAAISNDLDVLQALLGAGLDINSMNEAGYTPLMFAAAYNTPKAVQYMIDQGADLSAKAYVQDMNALHVAAMINQNPDMIDVLVAAGLPLEQKVEADYTALLIAASSNRNLEVAERLALLGADIGAYEPEGKNAARLIEERVRGEGDRIIRITDEVTARVITALKGE